MSRRLRRNHSPAFNAKVAIKALAEGKTIAEIAHRLNEAVAQYGAPEIVNTDEGSQFSSAEFGEAVKDCRAQQSMDGQDCWRDNVFVDRLWRSVKYEEVYLRACDIVGAARSGIARYFKFYNARRPHRAQVACRPNA
jgi:putative transposase